MFILAVLVYSAYFVTAAALLKGHGHTQPKLTLSHRIINTNAYYSSGGYISNNRFASDSFGHPKIRRNPMSQLRKMAAAAIDDNPDYCGPEGNKLRAEANSHAQERGRLFDAANKAFEAGDKAKARELSDQAKAAGAKMETAHVKAAAAILKHRNSGRPDTYLDLHGLRLEEALSAVTDRITALQAKAATAAGGGGIEFELIPGAGHHSAGSAVLKPKVMELLHAQKLSFVEKNAGTLLVTISPQSNAAKATPAKISVSEAASSPASKAPNSSSSSTGDKKSTSETKTLISKGVSVTGRVKQIPPMLVKFLANLKSLLMGEGWGGKFQISRESLKQLGINMLLSYGFVSNVSYVTCLILAWVSHGKRYGKSPLAAGQWRAFLVVYGGLWAANNVLRPLRFTLSLAIAPTFDTMIDAVQQRFSSSGNISNSNSSDSSNGSIDNSGLERKWARLLVILAVNVVGTISYLIGGIFIASRIANIPFIPM